MSDIQLFCGDCLEVMRGLPDGCVDAVVTDPPFGINFKYATHDDTSNGYGEWLWSAMQEAERLCRSGSPLFVWQAMPNVRNFSKWFPREWRIFAACKNFVQMRPIAMQYAFDPVIVWWTVGERWSAKTANRDYYVANTNPMTRKPGMLNYVKGHPCPRPLDQVQHIVEQWVRPGGAILDCFMGSGTTGVAAIRTGRSFMGIEIDPAYYAISEKRIAEAQMQTPLLEVIA